MGLSIGYLPGLTETYPEEKEPSISSYLHGIPTGQVLLVVSANLAEQKQFGNVRELLEYWFRTTNAAFANEAYKRLRPIENKYGKLEIATSVAALKLYQHAFSNLTTEKTLTDEQIEINLFKAFLHLNDIINSTEKTISDTTKHLSNDIRLYALHFSNAIRFSDVINYDLHELLISEFLRAVIFFEFLANRKDTAGLLAQFYAAYDVKTWKEYLTRLSGLSFSILRKVKSGYVDLQISKDKDFDKNVAFIDTLSHVKFDDIPANDFKSIREKPLHKIEPGKYRVISELFCVERIFKGLYFILKNINDELPESEQVKAFRNLYTYNFSEQFALYTILGKAFPKKFVKISGEQISSKGYQGGPDFYSRFKNKGFLFESKDSLINAALKETGDFNRLREDLESKFYKDGQRPKAVMQLLNCIKDVFKERFRAIDPGYKTATIRLYPILVIHDRQLDVPGLNKIINHWFMAELQKYENEIDLSRVHPITVIDMGTLILIHENLNERKMLMENTIEAYHEFVKLPVTFRSAAERDQKGHDSGLPFSFFIKQLIRKQGLKRYPERFLFQTAGTALNEPIEAKES